MEQLIEAIASHLHVDIKDVQEEIRDTAIQSAGETPFYGVMPAAAALPGLSDAERERLQPAISAATLAAASRGTTPVAPAAIATPAAARRTPALVNTAVEITTARNDTALAAALRELETMLTAPVQLPKLMALLKCALHEALGFNQSFFAMLSQDRKYLVSRFVFGGEQAFRNLRIPVTPGNLFERLLEKPQALWVKDENRQQVIPLVPREFYKLIDVDEFFIMTIRVKGKPLGVLYGNRHGNDHPLDKVDYEKFRQLGLLLTKGFEQLGR